MDPGCYMGMVTAMTNCCSTTIPPEPMGVQLEITCLAVPGSGRVATSGLAQMEYGSSCKNAVDWLSDLGGRGIGERGMGTPRFDPSTLRKQYDVSGGGRNRGTWADGLVSSHRLLLSEVLTVLAVRASGALLLRAADGGQE